VGTATKSRTSCTSRKMVHIRSRVAVLPACARSTFRQKLRHLVLDVLESALRPRESTSHDRLRIHSQLRGTDDSKERPQFARAVEAQGLAYRQGASSCIGAFRRGPPGVEKRWVDRGAEQDKRHVSAIEANAEIKTHPFRHFSSVRFRVSDRLDENVGRDSRRNLGQLLK